MRYRITIKEAPDRTVAMDKLAKAVLAAARARRDQEAALPSQQEKAS